MMSDPTAEFFSDLRLSQRTVDGLPPSLEPPSLAAGYRIQAELVERLCAARGGAPMGYKVALTSSTAQSLVGFSAPIFGRLLSHSSAHGDATLNASDFTTCIVETEISFAFGRDVPPGDYTQHNIGAFVRGVLPSIELVDHRFAGLDQFSGEALAADNAIHGGWYGGDERTDWPLASLDQHAAKLVVNGETALTGAGDRVLGHPLAVLAWLANELPQHGLGLKAGDYVTTGLVTDGIYEAQAGDTVRADFGELGSVTLTFI